MEAAKEMTSLGLAADQQEADITKKYMESLKIAYDIGMNGIEAVQQVERTFIDPEGGSNARSNQAVSPSNQSPGGAMAPGPGNEMGVGASPMAVQPGAEMGAGLLTGGSEATVGTETGPGVSPGTAGAF